MNVQQVRDLLAQAPRPKEVLVLGRNITGLKNNKGTGAVELELEPEKPQATAEKKEK